jgi:hypothetical protein
MQAEYNVRSGQQGMSLVSLMIGILISMIGILAGMMLYQNMVKVSIQARTDAAQDGQLASAMLSLQLELQSAGFGIDLEADAGPHWALSNADPQTLYWRYQDTSVAPSITVCKAFRIQDVEANVRRQLQLLTPETAGSCTLNANLAALAGGWKIETVLAEFRASAAAAAQLPVITLASAVRNCFPYGLGQAASYRMISVSADGAARRAAIDAGDEAPAIAPISYDFCLPNISE